jgi:dolichol-phosphate mannosyltransferase
VASYNEESNIEMMYERISNTLKNISEQYEILFVDNGSTDNSLNIFKNIIRKDKNVVVVTLSRNFNGSQGAFSAGMEHATGDCIINIDGDGEDPPEVIPQFIEKWTQGYDIVYGVRRKRKVSIIKNILYKLFYRVFRKLAYINIPLDSGEFALYDRKVINVLNKMPEKDRFLRGLRAWVGFKNIGLLYDRQERMHGQTSNSFFGNIAWAFKAIFSFSYAPLMLISVLSFVTFILALFGVLVYFISYFFTENPPQGIATIIILILLLGSIQLLSISIIGGYIAKIIQEVKNRPTHIVDRIMKDGKV